MQNNKKYILSTRPLPEALLAEAAAQNCCIDVVSFIETIAVIDDATATYIRSLFQKPITVVFTSMNAVAAVAGVGHDTVNWKVYSIGNTTAKTVTQLFQIPIAGTANDAAALADVIINDGIKEVVFFCGDQRRETLPEKLRNANIPVEEIVVYQTVETPQVIKKANDAILFFSPSAVHSFFSINKINQATTLFAIGATTADAIKQYASNPIIVAVTPDKEKLVRQVIEYFNSKKQETE